MMTLNDALIECLRDGGVRVELGSCVWVAEKDPLTVWVYMEAADGEVTSYRIAWLDLQMLIVTKNAHDSATE